MQADLPYRALGETPAALSPSAVQIERGYFWAMRRLGSFFWVQSFFGTCFSILLYPPALFGAGILAWFSYDKSIPDPMLLMAALALLGVLISGGMLLMQSIRIATGLRNCLPLPAAQTQRYVPWAVIHFSAVGLTCCALASISFLFLIPTLYCVGALACAAGLRAHLRDPRGD
jgi:hypothetical protein